MGVPTHTMRCWGPLDKTRLVTSGPQTHNYKEVVVHTSVWDGPLDVMLLFFEMEWKPIPGHCFCLCFGFGYVTIRISHG